mmetsp:Transcript_28306/g.71833  ORF Transcript_28306/g.71833 Transcript_28306/m.71833 type:complete len:130 (+) Transcript_28306:53-442(+)|eukprot:g7796.t1
MAGGQASDVESILKAYQTEYPTVIGYVLMNSDGIPCKWDAEHVTYDRAVMISALMMDYVQNCKRSLRELIPGPESELQNVRLRTSDGVELVAISTNEYTLVTMQNCTGKPWDFGEEVGGAGGGGGEGGS